MANDTLDAVFTGTEPLIWHSIGRGFESPQLQFYFCFTKV
jgi:hypothetical protein